MNIQANHSTQLSMDELDEVNGGIPPLVIGFVIGYAAGLVAGAEIAR